MAEELSGGAKCIKYLLFVFNFLFLLAGVALIIVGAIVQVQTGENSFGNSVSNAGIFIIVIGSIVFIICFFGCAGAINNNYCMVVTYGVLLLLLLLAQIAGIIVGFVLRDKVQETITQQMLETQKDYDDDPKTIATQYWNQTQTSFKCCGTTGYMSWNESAVMEKANTVPGSCCKDRNNTDCGVGKLHDTAAANLFYKDGCTTAVVELTQKYMVAVGAVAAGVAVLELIGIIFAFCLANSLRKDYRVV
jgi:CD63 antigen